MESNESKYSIIRQGAYGNDPDSDSELVGHVLYFEATEEPRHTKEYAPAVESVGQRHSWQYLGEFGQPSPWRGQPNEEVDEAWNKIAKKGAISVTKQELERLGKLHNSSVILPDESGGGYMASMEASHQMHCLDMLRKFSYRDYFADKTPVFSDALKLRPHLGMIVL
ncbi:hypothetical protein O1611_g8000 [Lasiodiplodia mahajangana]|uniref:Uncharacterized protein n=1 Tax=Lasiodiplodia mahajangana TaxID=1108764 RepID=A0ACC2JDU1_9PEZI|nr:hypothetical protein O1611_g8000 [Lasiodiplodia mahajangana]